MSVPTPSSEALSDTLSVLLGREMTARESAPRVPEGDDLIAEYRRANGTLGAVLSIDKATAVYASAALVSLPKFRADAAAEARDLSGLLAENFSEIANVLGALLNWPGSDHLRFTGFVPAVPETDDVRALLSSIPRSAGFTLLSDWCPAGTLGVFIDPT